MKKIIAMILIVALILCMVGCEKEGPSDSAGNEIVNFKYHDGYSIIVDSETGVNYILYDVYQQAGLAPRYHADGTLYVSEVE